MQEPQDGSDGSTVEDRHLQEMAKDLKDRLAELAEPTLEGMGYALVRAQVSGKKHPTVQIMAERKDRQAMTVDDCAEISRALSAVFDVEDPIKGSYSLEVSSPGIDRPLMREEDYERFAGFDAKVEMARPIDGRKRFSGRVLGCTGGHVRLRVQDGEQTDVDLPLSDVAKAKLILTDELIAAHERQDV